MKFVSSQREERQRHAKVTPKETDPKPKSILKQANGNNNKTCIQNNVYQTEQFQNKQNRFNMHRKKSESRGRLEVVTQKVEVLD